MRTTDKQCVLRLILLVTLLAPGCSTTDGLASFHDTLKTIRDGTSGVNNAAQRIKETQQAIGQTLWNIGDAAKRLTDPFRAR